GVSSSYFIAGPRKIITYHISSVTPINHRRYIGNRNIKKFYHYLITFFRAKKFAYYSDLVVPGLVNRESRAGFIVYYFKSPGILIINRPFIFRSLCIGGIQNYLLFPAQFAIWPKSTSYNRTIC